MPRRSSAAWRRSAKGFRAPGGGCGALLSDAEAFASHCGEVEHDDDFAYDSGAQRALEGLWL